MLLSCSGVENEEMVPPQANNDPSADLKEVVERPKRREL